jgi:hypothetical protein
MVSTWLERSASALAGREWASLPFRGAYLPLSLRANRAVAMFLIQRVKRDNAGHVIEVEAFARDPVGNVESQSYGCTVAELISPRIVELLTY